ncbi:chromosomal replication initiator protein DnaA [Lacticaseibacillus sharpeae]|uniref:Chromosomal replication initiator protein DnaA n=1 Tax=Lacticaseibacillus sharpeae JCM 1186 = DSM 20505 TaxID=1291052 RepID=A0A0R1ZKU0_9LACO|nr:chromosomal replication initiator protein DnaA [Lacticaseibacillus sharpeae]KRM55581.1 dnaA protein [Lacticaseibacillus sharpeae JCM 1186 = DSM 20505]
MDELWAYITDHFRENMSSVAYTTWIESATPVRLNADTLEIQVPDQLHQTYWQKNLAVKVVEAAYSFNGTELSPVITIKGDEPETTPEPEAEVQTAAPTPTFKTVSHLNSRYTFEDFVIGKGNQMAHAAALAVSDEPGTLYNPLFLYGGVGLGKTHLMQAIGHHMLQNNPNANVKYVSGEDFTNDFINSIQSKRQEQFRQEYRNVDLLLVDDIQFFGDKEGTQEEFFHTFNALFNSKKQIVLTSDRLPNEIPKLQDRLVSRFKWGLSVDITPPDLETRIAILRNKATDEGLDAPEDTLHYIAGQIDSNVRELEGALLRVKIFAETTKSPITTSLAADALKTQISGKNTQLTIAEIQEMVAKYYQVSVTDIKGRKRVKQIVMPRQIAMYLARELTDSSLPQIGREFGGKDHTTVIHAVDKIEKAASADADLKASIIELKNKLKNRG